MIKIKNLVSNKKIWAFIICFYPENTKLITLVERLVDQVDSIYILNNGGLRDEIREKLVKISNIVICDYESNLGIATALNRGLRLAEFENVDFAITFDQDSEPLLNHVSMLLDSWDKLNINKISTIKIGAIGPVFFDDRKKEHEYSFSYAKGLIVHKVKSTIKQNIVEADILITSGMLFPLTLWRDDIRFKESLFIDLVDTDWCFRARAKGYKHFGSFNVRMKHAMSDSHPVRVFGVSILKYSPLRRYYYFRNCISLIKKSYTPIAYRIRFTIGLIVMLLCSPIIDEHKLQSIIFILKGILDGFREKLGPYNVK
jgi:rhamnosyltransferase